MSILYEDAGIVCDADGVTIHWYYFPAGDKRLHYSEIREAMVHDMSGSAFRGRYRIWGGDLRHWFNLDTKRPSKSTALILDVGSWVRPVITPDDPGAVQSILEDQGVAVRPAD